jgi:ATPase subunit of ABC transporter with duplicated ATPase domains
MSQDEPNKIIYSMTGVAKTYNDRQVIKDISLSYFYGAKIGVIGLNASGKSTLLRIMAGVDPSGPGIYYRLPGTGTGAGRFQDRAGRGRRGAQRDF